MEEFVMEDVEAQVDRANDLEIQAKALHCMWAPGV